MDLTGLKLPHRNNLSKDAKINKEKKYKSEQQKPTQSTENGHSSPNILPTTVQLSLPPYSQEQGIHFKGLKVGINFQMINFSKLWTFSSTLLD